MTGDRIMKGNTMTRWLKCGVLALVLSAVWGQARAYVCVDAAGGLEIRHAVRRGG